MKKKGIIILLVVLLAIPFVCGAAFFGWTVNSVFAQGPWQGSNYRTMHNNQVVWQLLQSDPDVILQQRQAGKSLLDIAAAKGVSEQALLDTLLQPMTGMHAWMQQQYPQTNMTNMLEAMRQQFAQDMRVAQYGTMTDMHLFGMNSGMMGMMGAPQNGAGMMNDGMMHGSNGMMGAPQNGGGMMNGGMMHGNAPTVNATPVPSTQKVDREIKIVARNFKFEPTNVKVKKGETIKFILDNQDSFPHNAVSQDAKFAYTFLPANQTVTILWTAPQQVGTYNFVCTFHPKMDFAVTVE